MKIFDWKDTWTDLTQYSLHRYDSIDQNFYSNLINGELWFSDPLKFNDPYDCNLHDESNCSYEEIEKYIDIVGEWHDFDKAEKFKRAKQIFSNQKKEMSDILKSQIGRYGITCFSLSDKNLLMWAHYANKHSGICLTFDVRIDKDFFSVPLKVFYTDTYPKFSFVKEALELSSDVERLSIKSICFSLGVKSIDWSYEKEVRILKNQEVHSTNRGLIPFNKVALSDVKFGLRTDKKQIITICKILNQNGYEHVRTWIAKLSDDKFEVIFEKIDKNVWARKIL